jgi:hypothetical protein
VYIARFRVLISSFLLFDLLRLDRALTLNTAILQLLSDVRA